MPRLRPISIKLLENGDKAESIRLIKDLLILTPRGMNQNLRASAYIKHHAYPGKDAYIASTVDGSRHDRKYSAEEYGYTSAAIYYAMRNLGCEGTHVGDWECRRICGLVIFDNRSAHGAKITRSANRLNRRASASWSEAITSGVLGDMTYEVTVSTPTIGRSAYRGHRQQAEIRFAAASKAEAEVMLSTMFTHATDGDPGRFNAWKVAEPAEVMSTNLQEVEKLRAARKQCQKEIDELQAHMINIETLEEALTMYSMTALGEDN
jgi:hypothetical protein